MPVVVSEISMGSMGKVAMWHSQSKIPMGSAVCVVGVYSRAVVREVAMMNERVISLICVGKVAVAHVSVVSVVSVAKIAVRHPGVISMRPMCLVKMYSMRDIFRRSIGKVSMLHC